MLRVLLIVLLLANVLAFGAVQGWLGGNPPRTEPERLNRQIQPDTIQLAGEIAPGPAPAEPTSHATDDPRPDAVEAAEPEGATEDRPPADAGIAAEPEAAEPPAIAAETAAAAAPVASAPDNTPVSAPPPVCMVWSELSTTEADQLAARLRRTGTSFSRNRTEVPGSWWVRIPPQPNQEQAEQRVREARALGVTDSFIVQDNGPNRHAVSLGLFKTEARARQMLNQLRTRGLRNAGIEPRMVTTFRIQAQLSPAALRTVEAAPRIAAGRRVPCANR